MFFVDGFVCGGEPIDSIRITEAKPLEDRIILVTFNSGEERVFDSSVLDGEVFEPLKDKAIFDGVVVEHGVLTWQNGEIDCAPEYVYANSFEYAHMTA